jgi:SpoVK/Ycf46/Vps4 family AAA+-type ATPase
VKHPNEKRAQQLSNKYLKTSRQLTIRHLYKFLAKKLGEADYKIFKIYLPDDPQPLGEDLTLDIIDKHVKNLK